MTTSDLSHVDAFLARAERGTPRGAAEVLASAREGLPTPLPRQPRPARRAVVAAACLLVGGAVAGALAIGRDGTTTPSGADAAWCEALGAVVPAAPGNEGDVVAYLRPEASANLDALAQELTADRRVETTRRMGQAATLERFRALFADQAPLITSVSADDLPTSVAIDLVDPADAGTLIDELNERPGMFLAVPGWGDVRALDLLVWPGANAGAWASPGNFDLGISPYPPSWPERADAVGIATPPELAAPVETLLQRITHGPAEQHSPERSDDAPGPSFEAARSAAGTVRAAAKQRCGLEAADWSTRRVTSETVTTQATSGD